MKTIVITGATKGIGKAISEKFAKEGFGLAICSRHQDELNAHTEHLLTLGAALVYSQPCDVAKKTDLLDFSKNVEKKLGHVDILVNNAGVFIPGKLSDEDDGLLEMVIKTNLYSAYHLTRMLLPLIKKSKSPYIFNMCSTASTMAYENGGSYCISKFALLGMTKVLRQELKSENIKVSAIMPGATLTASWEGTDLPASRFMQAAEVAEVLWCAFQLPGNAVMEEIVLRPIFGDI